MTLYYCSSNLPTFTIPEEGVGGAAEGYRSDNVPSITPYATVTYGAHGRFSQHLSYCRRMTTEFCKKKAY